MWKLVVCFKRFSKIPKTKGTIKWSKFLKTHLFFIFINILSDNFLLNCKLFTNETSLFSIAHDATISSFELNPIQDNPISFLPVTSTNVLVSAKNFLNFNFNLFAKLL